MPRTRAVKHKAGQVNGLGTLAAFDLGALRLQGRFSVGILGPENEPTPVVITLCSRYGKEYRLRAAAIARARIESAAAASPTQEDSTETLAESFVLDLLVALTVEWSGVVVDGETWTCTPATVRTLYTAEGLGWIYNQVADGYFARERFFVKPSNAS